MSLDPLLVAAGAMTGLVVGMTGVGGGALMTPLLLLVFGVAPLAAVGTDLWFAALTKLAAVGVHHRHALIDWRVASRLWMGSLPAAACTLIALRLAHAQVGVAAILTVAIGATVLMTALGLLFQKRLSTMGTQLLKHRSGRIRAFQLPATIGAGIVLGMAVTLTSVGAGALGAVFLAYLYPLRLSPPRLVATDIVHAIPLAVLAGAGHAAMGNVDVPLLLNLLVGSVPAVIVGALLSARLPHGPVRVMLALVLSVVAVKLIASGLAH